MKPEREQGIARTALALMTECEVPATPENFELFYAYAAGDNPSLTPVMGGLLASRKPFTPELLAELRLRCLSSARAAYLAICFDESDKLKAAHPHAWSAAIVELEKHPAVIKNLFHSPSPAGDSLRHRAKAAGLQAPPENKK